MQLQFERRLVRSKAAEVLAPLLAVVSTLFLGAVLFALLDYAPLPTLYAFFIEPISSLYGISELLVKAVPLIIIATGLAVGFRANVWNIGAEGQLIMGAIAATGTGLFWAGADTPGLLVLMMIAGVLGGMFWAGIAAFLRSRFHTNEILVTLMLTYIASLLLSWLVRGPWRDPAGFNFPQTALLPHSGMLEPLDISYRVTGSLFFAIVLLIVLWIFISRSFAGYKMSVGGAAPRAASYAGFASTSAIWIGLLSGGAAAGVTGFFEVAGPLGQLSPNISPGYGFAAIIVAFIGRLHPIGILFGGLFLALTYLGGENVQISNGIPAPITRVFQGLLLMSLLASEIFSGYRISLKRKTA